MVLEEEEAASKKHSDWLVDFGWLAGFYWPIDSHDPQEEEAVSSEIFMWGSVMAVCAFVTGQPPCREGELCVLCVSVSVCEMSGAEDRVLLGLGARLRGGGGWLEMADGVP